MPAAFLHGIEVVEVNIGPIPVTVVKSAVIGLVGIAPTFYAPTPAGLTDHLGAWKATTRFLLGQSVIDPNGNVQLVTASTGNSGGSAPSWSTVLGATTADAAVTWTNRGPFTGSSLPAWSVSANATYPRWNGRALYFVGDVVLDSNGNLQRCVVPGTSTAPALPAQSVEPTWATVLGSGTADNGITWQLVALDADGIVNKMILVNGTRDAGRFGPQVRGYTIPYALAAIQSQGSGQAIVVNVWDRTIDVDQLNGGNAEAVFQFPAAGPQVIQTQFLGIGNVLLTDNGIATAYVLGVDYTVDWVRGRILSLATQGNPTPNGLAVGDAVAATFTFPAYGEGASFDDRILGNLLPNGDEPPAGTFAGLQLFPLAYGLFGFFPKILIAPGFSQVQDVAVGFDSMAQRIRAVSVVDTPGLAEAEPPAGPTPDNTPLVQPALQLRGDLASAFAIASKRTILCYPNLLSADHGIFPGLPLNDPLHPNVAEPDDSSTDGPYSAWLAGAIAAQDLENGYWFSPSNRVMTGPQGPDVALYMSAFDPTSDTNLLNAAGIVTVFATFASGLRVWGNRSSAYPAATTPDVFISIRRTLDVMEESAELFALQFLDGPITNSWITAVVQSLNSFVRTLIQRGALEPGSKVTYNPDENPPSELANGHVTFDFDVMPPPPAERITFNVFIDTNLLSNVTGQAAATP